MMISIDRTSMAIRSFVRRRGRITPAQQRALETLWPHYGIDSGNQLNLEEMFGRNAPKHLEIGFGMGEALIEMAKTHPEQDYLGVDVHWPGIGSLLLKIHAMQLLNIRVLCGDIVEILQHRLPSQSLDVVYLFFPDPWPKKRHHKRRLVQSSFINLLAEKMSLGARLHLATDWQDYAEHMLQVLECASSFTNSLGKGCFAPRPLDRPVTKFEQRGQRLGHGVWDLLYQRR